MKFSDRREPPETPEEHAFIWSSAEKAHEMWANYKTLSTGAERAHEMWAVLGVIVAILNNWKGIMIGMGLGLAIGGKDLLLAIGVALP